MEAEDSSADPGLGEAVRRGVPSLPADAWSALEAVETALLGAADAPRLLAGRYELRNRIGAGGLGVVHRGYDRELDREVAIKLVRRPDRDPGSIARQVHEARMLAHVQHPNIVEVFDIVDDAAGGQVCIVMELIDGVDMRRWLRHARRTTAEIVSVFVAAGTALAAAHAVGVVHCDFKPTNVVIGEDGRVRVLDFGLARFAALDGTDAGSSSASGRASKTTSIGGTPAYMAPEQRRGTVTPAVDQYAFCVSLYECLVGALPLRSDSEHDGVPRLQQRALAAVPRSLRNVVVRGSAPDPARRFPDMRSLVAVLARRRGLGTIGVIALLVTLVGSSIAIASSVREPVACELRSEGAWDEEAREHVVTRLEQLVEPAAAEHAAATFDQRWAALAQAWAIACESEDDARFGCLRRLRGRFGGLARTIVDGDPNAAFAAASELGRDPGLAACEASPDPSDAALRSEASAAELDRLAEAEAMCGAGGAKDGLAIATEVRTQAEAEGADALLARASLVEGRCAAAIGRLDEGLAALERAVPAAQANGDDRTAVMAASTLCTATAMAQHAGDAVHWCEVAQSSLERAGDDPVLRGNVERAWSALAFANNEHGVAREHIELAIAAWRESTRRDELARDLGNAAKLALSDNRAEDGRKLIAEAIEIERELAVLEGPQLAGRLHVLCGIEHVARRSTIALDHCLEAWKIIESGVPEHSPVVLGVAITTATVLEQLGRYAEAIPFARAAIAAVEATRGPEDPDLVIPLGLLGLALAHGSESESAEAEAVVHRAVVLAESNFPSDHPSIATAYGDLGGVLHRQGKFDAAIPALRRSLEIVERSFGETNVETLRVAIKLAAALVDQGNCEEARPLFKRALAGLPPENVTARADAEQLRERCRPGYRRPQ